MNQSPPTRRKVLVFDGLEGIDSQALSGPRLILARSNHTNACRSNANRRKNMCVMPYWAEVCDHCTTRSRCFRRVRYQFRQFFTTQTASSWQDGECCRPLCNERRPPPTICECPEISVQPSQICEVTIEFEVDSNASNPQGPATLRQLLLRLFPHL